jgi:hypothetical protein
MQQPRSRSRFNIDIPVFLSCKARSLLQLVSRSARHSVVTILGRSRSCDAGKKDPKYSVGPGILKLRDAHFK